MNSAATTRSSPRPSPTLESQVATCIDAIDARAWDALVTKPGMSHAAARAVDAVSVDADSVVYAMVSDRDGPYAAIAARPHADSPMLRRVLGVRPPLGRFGGIQLRRGVALDDALPRLSTTLARMARLRHCAAYSVYAPRSDAPAFAKSGFVNFEGPASNRSDLTRFGSYDALLAQASRTNRHEVRRARRRSEQFGLRFEITTPPRADTKALHRMVRATYEVHGDAMPYVDGFFDRFWATPFADHVLVCAYHGERLAAASWCYRNGTTLVASTAALDYAIARPSYAYFTLLDEIVRYAFATGVETIEWGMSNDAIKRRHGAEPVPGFAAVRLAIPVPSLVWRGIQTVLSRPGTARALGVAGEEN